MNDSQAALSQGFPLRLTLRTEYRNLADARGRIGEFLEGVYNGKGLHSALQLPGAERI